MKVLDDYSGNVTGLSAVAKLLKIIININYFF